MASSNTEAVVTLVSAIKDKYCTAPEPYYGMEVIHSQGDIKVIASSKRPGIPRYSDTQHSRSVEEECIVGALLCIA